VGTGGLFPGVEWPECKADHSPPSSAEVKNGGAIPPLPHMYPLLFWMHDVNHTFHLLCSLNKNKLLFTNKTSFFHVMVDTNYENTLKKMLLWLKIKYTR
jgi:hypothetical protein